MRRPRHLAAGAAATAALSVIAGVIPSAGPGRPASAAGARSPVIRLHPGVTPLRGGPLAAPPTVAQCEKQFKSPCYGPAQIRQAYGLPALYSRGVDGAGETIVLVDAFGSPTIRRDLASFDKTFGLPAPPSLKIIQPAGKVPPHQLAWAGETSLDVEWSHAVAPDARILLVETPVNETEGTAGFPQIVTAENYVIHHHLGDVISQSFGATEQSFPTAQSLLRLRSAYLAARSAGITVLASTGDSGAANPMRNGTDLFLYPTVEWPASDPLVTAVGGTELHLNQQGRRTSPDTVWNDTYKPAITHSKEPSPAATGGGKSVIFARPSYQDGVQAVTGAHRGTPDIAMSAACDGFVWVYLSFGGLRPGLYGICGTSEASPLFAGIVALTAQVAGHPLGLINPLLYKMYADHDPGIVDVTSGNNTVSFVQDGKLHTVKGYSAGPGYDLASGVGTVYAPDFVPELAHLAAVASRGTS